jgi:DNA-binding NarL/FixJ family response regulator
VIRTLVSADSPLDRAGLSALLRDAPPIEVVGSSLVTELGRAVADLGPDVVVEFRESEAVTTRLPTVSLVADPSAAWSARVEDAGGGRDGFAVLPRDAEANEVWAAVIAVDAGLAVVPVRALPGESTAPNGHLQRGSEKLSAREVDVLTELARGTGNKQIATRLGISEHTVKFHVGSIFAKLGVSNRTEAVTQGIRLGLILL